MLTIQLSVKTLNIKLIMFADEREKKLYVKRAGPYLLGPTLENSPVKSITHCDPLLGKGRWDGVGRTNSYLLR
jgi:hypothetical protein